MSWRQREVKQVCKSEILQVGDNWTGYLWPAETSKRLSDTENRILKEKVDGDGMLDVRRMQKMELIQKELAELKDENNKLKEQMTNENIIVRKMTEEISALRDYSIKSITLKF